MVVTHYQLLAVANTATVDEIKKAFRKLALELHPDVNGGNAEKTAKFVLVTSAYEVLLDVNSRRLYDVSISVRRAPVQGPNPFQGSVRVEWPHFYRDPVDGRRQQPPTPKQPQPPRPPKPVVYPTYYPPTPTRAAKAPEAPKVPRPIRPGRTEKSRVPRPEKPQRSAHPFEGFPDLPPETDLPHTFEDWDEYLKEAMGDPFTTEEFFGQNAGGTVPQDVPPAPDEFTRSDWDYFMQRSAYYAAKQAEAVSRAQEQQRTRDTQRKAAAENAERELADALKFLQQTQRENERRAKEVEAKSRKDFEAARTEFRESLKRSMKGLSTESSPEPERKKSFIEVLAEALFDIGNGSG